MDELGTVSESKSKRDVDGKAKQRCCRLVEIIVLTLVVLLVCGNFAVPTIFFYLRPTDVGGGDATSDVCLEPAVYSGATCRAELQVYQECFSGSAGSNDILIRSDINQETVETDAELLIESGLSFLNPSAECVAAIRPFLCLYLFGVCDSSSQLRQVSSSECVDLREDICATEWSAAVVFLGPGRLPVCENLPTQMPDESCVNSTSLGNISSGFMKRDASSGSQVVNFTRRECKSNYYLSNDNLCLPVCGNYTNTGNVLENTASSLIILSCCIAIISALLVIILSFTVQRKFMLTFPSTFLLYLCLTTVLESAIILIGFFDREALFCNSIDLMESFNNPTPFCTISGIVFYYTLMQTTLWVLFHVAALFWGIVFPFHYRKIKANGYINYIHITAVAVAVLMPLVSALAPLKDGFISPRSPPILCIGANADYTFYTLVLPISILLAVSTCLLIITFWMIFKEFIIKKMSKGKEVLKYGKAEVKIMFSFCYYILLGGLVLGVFSYYVGINERIITDQQTFFICESFGVNAGNDCEAVRSTSNTILSELALVAIVLQGLGLLVILVFIVDCKCKRTASKKVRDKTI